MGGMISGYFEVCAGGDYDCWEPVRRVGLFCIRLMGVLELLYKFGAFKDVGRTS